MRPADHAPRVGVVVPCFDDGGFLRDALSSIEEPEDVSIVVVDDCSTDRGTLALLAELPDAGVRVVRHEHNRGPAAARNSGLAALESQYVFPLDADDLAVAGMLTDMADRLDADPAAVVCYGDYLEFGDHELVRAVPSWIDGFRLAYANEYPISSLLRKTALEEVGGWRDVGYEDWDLWMALAERGSGSAYIGAGRLTFKKRIHGERRLRRDKLQHTAVYRQLRDGHPALFSDLRGLRRASDLRLHRKLLYPIVYGGRRRYRFEGHVKQVLDRSRIWTLRR